MSTSDKPVAILVTNFKIENFSFSKPTTNKTTKKIELTPLYNGKPFYIQLGTEAEPLSLVGGVKRWDQAAHSYVKLTDGNAQWATGSKPLYKKYAGQLSTSISLRGYANGNKQAFAAVKMFEAIEQKAVATISGGAVQPDDTVVPVCDIALPAEFVRKQMTNPLSPATPEYEPKVNAKMRYHVAKGSSTDSLTSDDTYNPQTDFVEMQASIYNADDNNKEVTSKTVEFLSGNLSGRWIGKFSPLKIKETGESTFSFEITTAELKRRATTAETDQSVGFAIEECDGPVENVDFATDEPPAKRQAIAVA